MIEKISPGSVVIDGTEYNSDVLIIPPSKVEEPTGEPKTIDRVVCPWKRKDESIVTLADLGEVIPKWPDVLIVGTGFSEGLKVSPDIKTVLQAKGIHVIVMGNEMAVEAYNEMAGPDTKAAFALHLE